MATDTCSSSSSNGADAHNLHGAPAEKIDVPRLPAHRKHKSIVGTETFSPFYSVFINKTSGGIHAATVQVNIKYQLSFINVVFRGVYYLMELKDLLHIDCI